MHFQISKIPRLKHWTDDRMQTGNCSNASHAARLSCAYGQIWGRAPYEVDW